MLAIAWIAIGLMLVLPVTRRNLFAVTAVILILPVSLLLWVERLAWTPRQHHIPVALWIAITCVLLAVPFALARVRPALLIALAPLLAFGYQAGRIYQVWGWRTLLEYAIAAAALALFLYLMARFEFPRLALRALLAFTACVAIAGTFLFVAWSDKAFSEESFSQARRPEPAAGLQNIVIVVIDTLRADRLGAMGYRVRDTSPFLDRFAARATLFKNAYASTSWTVPSVATMFTGLPPEAHGITIFGRSFSPHSLVLAEKLRRAGYYTIGVSTNPLITDEGGFSRGFEDFTLLTRLSSSTGAGGSLWSDVLITMQRGSFEGWLPRKFIGWTAKPRAADAVDVALRRLQAAPPGAPVFLFVHLLDPHHPPSNPPTEATRGWVAKQEDNRFDARWSVGYDREIRYVDSQLETLIRGIDARLDSKKTTIVIVSDHGEELGERSRRGHGQNLDEAVIRVPLIIRTPGQSGVVVEDLFSLNRLRDLILDPSKSVPRASMVRAHLVPPAQTDVVFRSVESAEWKFLEIVRGGRTVSRQLFRLPDESSDRAAALPLVAAELQSKLAPLSFNAGTAPYDAETAAKLRSLGYVQ